MKKWIRSFLAKNGYVLWKWNFIRFGVSPFLDVGRLNSAWGRQLEIVFDVGANAGQFTQEVRRRFPHVVIHSFEPHPTTFEALVRQKVDDRMLPHCLALGEKNGPVSFFEYGENSEWNSLVPNARFTTQFSMKNSEITVESMTLDDFCVKHEINHIDLLKLDVEGAELSVLKGAQRMLRLGRIMAIYCEFNDLCSLPGSAGGALIPLADYLSNFGLRYACTYTDNLLFRRELFVVANALFVLPPRNEDTSREDACSNEMKQTFSARVQKDCFEASRRSPSDL